MSDQSIASIARSLAAALLAARAKLGDAKEGQERVAELEQELCAEYRAELVETLTV